MRQLVSFVAVGLLAVAPALAQSAVATLAPVAPSSANLAPVPEQTAQAGQGRGGGGGAGGIGSGGGGGGRGGSMAPIAGSAQNVARRVPTQNVRLEVTITDSFGTGPTKKTVSILVADGRTGQVRASMTVQSGPNATTLALNVDAAPEVLPDGRVFVNMSVQYTPDSSYQQSGSAPKPASLNESLSVVLSDGKPTLVSQSTDPQGDRKVTLEFTASVIK